MSNQTRFDPKHAACLVEILMKLALLPAGPILVYRLQIEKMSGGDLCSRKRLETQIIIFPEYCSHLHFHALY